MYWYTLWELQYVARFYFKRKLCANQVQCHLGYIISHLFSLIVWGANKTSSNVYIFLHSNCSFQGIPVSLHASWKPPTPTPSMPLQHALGCPLSHVWLVYIQRGAHEWLASLPSTKPLACLNAKEQELNAEALWTAWLLNPVSMRINLILAAGIRNRIPLVATQSPWS